MGSPLRKTYDEEKVVHLIFLNFLFLDRKKAMAAILMDWCVRQSVKGIVFIGFIRVM